MKGIISFILLIFLLESFLIVLMVNSLEYEDSSDNLYHSVKLLDFYDKKMRIKRDLQNLLNSGPNIKNPVQRIEYVAKELENYEEIIELNSEYDIDIWCGYIDAQLINSLLFDSQKPSPIKDMSSRIMTETSNFHYCTVVLVYDNEINKVTVGRNFVDDYFNLIPAIGFTIKSKDNSFSDVDYVRG